MKKRCILTIVLFLLVCSQLFSNVQMKSVPPPVKAPLEVAVTLHINKIYNLNSVDETYQVDGYLLYSWNDPTVCKWYKKHKKENTNDSLSESIIFENERIEEIKDDIKIPVFELMNVLQGKETSNKSIELFPNGTVKYEERFFATFSADMNYKAFPFDTQKYLIEIEAFTYNNSKLIFNESNLLPKQMKYNRLGEDWQIIRQKDTITLDSYSELKNKKITNSNYSKVTFTIEAERLSGYYVWQVLFPLIIIILASFFIFWIDDFSTQIGIGFTLMLTVVAFNFYSVSILPKLPYNTYIEYIIIAGYVFIFLGILAVMIINSAEKNVKDKIHLFKYFRYLFPIAYAIVMVIFYLKLIVFPCVLN